MIEKMRARTRSTKTVSRIFCFLYSVVMFNAWVMINAMLSAMSKPVEKTRKRMDPDAAANRDNSSACPARAELQNAA